MKKRIIYCWFGNSEMDVVNKACLESWERVMPDYEILRIDETVFDPNMFANSAKLYAKKQYAFVSDIARVWALANYGGVYLDTDVYALKPLDNFLGLNAFFGILPNGNPNLGVLGGKEFWAGILEEYANMGDSFLPLGMLLQRKFNLPGKITSLQQINGCVLMPDSMFYAREKEPKTVPETAYNVHLFSGSVLSDPAAIRNAAKQYLLDVVQK